VEDRRTPALYLELDDGAPDDYARKRVGEVLALPGVERATWWQNLAFERDEFPRSLDDFRTLGVYEVSDGFALPASPPTGRGFHFRRTPRPAQGSLSGQPTVGLLLVLVTPRTPESAQRFRDWADFVHIRHIAAAGIEGFTMITPYENASGESPRYLHFYEMDAADPEAAFQQMAARTLERRLGGSPKTAEAREWFDHEDLVIDYVNTFARVGVAER
jgi:hypothetical protein